MTMNARIPDAFDDFTGQQQAFNYTSQQVAPTWGPGPTTVGSPSGVPPATYIAGMGPDTSTSTGNAYATDVLSRGAGSHPVLWSIIIFMTGIIVLGLVSHMEVKRRG